MKSLLHFDNDKLNQSNVDVGERVGVGVPLLKVIVQRLVKGVELGAREGVPVAGDGDADRVVRACILHRPRVHCHLVRHLVWTYMRMIVLRGMWITAVMVGTIKLHILLSVHILVTGDDGKNTEEDHGDYEDINGGADEDILLGC